MHSQVSFQEVSALRDLAAAAKVIVLIAGKQTQCLFILKEWKRMSLLPARHYRGLRHSIFYFFNNFESFYE